MIGWAPVDDRIKKWSFSEATYGPQLLTECTYFGSSPPPWCEPDAGNGACDPSQNTTGFCSSDGEIVGNDPTDTSQPIGTTWVTDWMAHIASRVGTAAQGGPRLWALDNEPMLWDSTHRDIAPTPLTYDEIWNRTVTYATAIKAQDPNAEILGPDLWGWCAYFSSASDAAFPNGSCVDGPDRQAHGGLAFIPWYLEQVCQYEVDHGIRLVDYLDIHVYPQGGVAGLDPSSSAEDPTTSARRLRSLKELWDPTYSSESWIAEPMYLLPRLRAWIDNHCAGLGLAVTEYKWGADDGASGSLAQAELLAIFGREGVELGTRWVAPEVGSRAEDAFRFYLDYDGAGSSVEGVSVSAGSDDVDVLGAYAVHRADDRLFLLLFNKDIQAREANLTLEGSFAGTVDVFRFDAATPLTFIETLTPGVSTLDVVLPPRSSTLVVSQLQGAANLIFEDGFESGDTTLWSAVNP